MEHAGPPGHHRYPDLQAGEVKVGFHRIHGIDTRTGEGLHLVGRLKGLTDSLAKRNQLHDIPVKASSNAELRNRASDLSPGDGKAGGF